MTEIEHLRVVMRAVDAVIETGRRLRSDPGSHELALAALCAAMAALAELPPSEAPIPDDLIVREFPA